MPKKKEKKEEAVEDGLELHEKIKKFLNLPDTFGYPTWFLSTGNLALDYIISGKIQGGGWPGGRICEIDGDPSTGKTVLIEKAGGAIQQYPDGIFIVGDSENKWSEQYAALHGVDPTKMIRWVPESIEEFGLKVIDTINEFKGKARMLFALDSLQGVDTEHALKQLDAGEFKLDQGLRARTIKNVAGKLPHYLHDSGAILLLSNHFYEVPGAYVPTKRASGGRGFMYHASIKLELSKPRPIVIKEKARALGVHIHAKNTKNDICPPFGECDIDLYWNSGIPALSGLLDIMIDLGIITQTGGWYSWATNNGRAIKFMRKDFAKIVGENPDILHAEEFEKPYFKQAMDDLGFSEETEEKT